MTLYETELRDTPQVKVATINTLNYLGLKDWDLVSVHFYAETPHGRHGKARYLAIEFEHEEDATLLSLQYDSFKDAILEYFENEGQEHGFGWLL